MPDGALGACPGATPSPSPTVRRALTAAIGRLRAAGIVGAPLDAGLLLADAMGRARGRLLTDDAEPLAGAAAGRFERHLARRLAREPVSRILGRREFWSLRAGDLAGRSRSPARQRDSRRGGFGGRPRQGGQCRDRRPRNRFGVPAAGPAVGAGRRLRCRRRSRSGRARCRPPQRPAQRARRARGLRRRGLGRGARGCFDIVLCNPPYLAGPELATAAAEVRHDPRLALAGGEDGLDAYRALVPGLPSCLAGGGRAFLEIGAAQAPAVGAIVAGAGLEVEAVVADLAGRDRCIVARAGGNPAGRQKSGWIRKPSGLGCQHLDAVGGRVSQGILSARRFGA